MIEYGLRCKHTAYADTLDPFVAILYNYIYKDI